MATYMIGTERVLSPGEVVRVEEPPKEPEVWHENLNIRLVCPECNENPPNLIENFASGDIVCDSCGMVLSSHLVDTRSEWRTFSNDDQGNDDPSRVGEAANPLLHGSQLSTSIAFGQGDANARELNRAQSKSTSLAEKGNKSLVAAYKQIDSYCSAIHLTNTVANTAKALYKIVDEPKEFRGKPQETIIAGCIFIACRQNGVPRTFKEIMSLTKVPKKEIGRTFKALEKFFREHNRKHPDSQSVNQTEAYKATTSTQAQELCDRFCSGLGIPVPVRRIVAECADLMLMRGQLAGRSPLSIAAVAIYVISHLMGVPKTPKEISAQCGVSDGTIRAAWRHIYDERMDLIKPEWIEKGGKPDLLPMQ